ncbi:hypothetical protein FBUS_03690 [Fasciolopsis buskii]|uniref:Uncharacterized protein n=1 Tax=Fasciolopsis buskii TaxID=27845 RepID=A0A8E0VN65_9TREM|nr:hypothetical protein FBUS_03690 [Fasciolopsis buski]
MLSALLFTVQHGVGSRPTRPVLIPLDMWLPGVFPVGLPKLSPKQAVLLNERDRIGMPPVMQDLSQPVGHLDMDDEFSVPYTTKLAIVTDLDLNAPRDDEQPNHKEADDDWEEEDEDAVGAEPSDRSKQLEDSIITSKSLISLNPRLLSGYGHDYSYGYGYGASTGVAIVPLVYKTHHAPSVLPLALTPITQRSQTGTSSSSSLSSAVLQPTLTHSQQTITINAQLPQQQQQQQQQQPQAQMQLQPQQDLTGQGRMAIPQVSQPIAIQPGQMVQPLVPSQPIIQPSGTLPGQGRFQWPTSGGSQAQNVQNTPIQQAQTQQQQQLISRRITVTHKIVPQNIRIVLPKQYKRYTY